jgi:hypothetical protein
MALNISLDAIKHMRKFDGKDFTTWKHSMEMLFCLKGLKDTVEVMTYTTKTLLHALTHSILVSFFTQGVNTQPEEEYEGEGENAILINGDEIETWTMTDCYARFIIFNCCDEARKLALLNSRTSHEMWTRLETQYLQRAADNKHCLHRDFFNLRLVISYNVSKAL